jgi:predicted acyltransferase
MIGPVANAGLKKLELFTKWFKVYDILRHFVSLAMQANARLESLDVFRGLTVAAMILVNNPGSWAHIYSPLEHAPWNGCTPTDLIFPFFLFIVGVSIHFAYQAKADAWFNKKTVFQKSFAEHLSSSLSVFFFLLFPKFDFSAVRIPGVLQRISLVFFFCSVLYLTTNWLTQIRIAAILLVAYYLLMTLVPVPGHWTGQFRAHHKPGSMVRLFTYGGSPLGTKQNLGSGRFIK